MYVNFYIKNTSKTNQSVYESLIAVEWVEKKDFEHSFQTNGFSPEWVLICFFKYPAWEKYLKHFSQAKGFSPEWVLILFFRWPAWEKDFKHYLQTKGFSLEWVLICFLKYPAWEKDLEQSLQTKLTIDHWPRFYREYLKWEKKSCWVVSLTFK